MKSSGILFQTLSKIWVALCLSAASTYGNLFDYSYRFTDGVLMFGTLNGDLDGEFVDHVSDVQVYFSGGNIPNAVAFAAEFGDFSNGGSPVLSFDVSKTKFLFSNGNNGSGYAFGDPHFYAVSSGTVDISVLPSSLSSLSIEPPDGGSWFLKARAPSQIPAVPEGGSALVMMGLSLAGFACLRRKMAK